MLSQVQTQRRFQRRRRGRIGTVYVYLLPAGVLLSLIFAYPTVQSVLLSFQRNAGINDPGEFSGFANFTQLWGDSLFWQVARQTFVWSGGSFSSRRF